MARCACAPGSHALSGLIALCDAQVCRAGRMPSMSAYTKPWLQSFLLVKVTAESGHHVRSCACAEQASVPIRDVQLGRHEREFELFDPRDAQRVVATIKV